MRRVKIKGMTEIVARNVLYIARTSYAQAIRYDYRERRFYYENADIPPDKFYFDTWEEAALDLAVEIGVMDAERATVKLPRGFVPVKIEPQIAMRA